MIIRRVGPTSFAKLSATLYAVIGLLIGGIISAVTLLGGAMTGTEAGPMGMLFGAAAVVLLPLCYAAVGFVATYIGAALYNLAAGWVGGVEIDVQ